MTVGFKAGDVGWKEGGILIRRRPTSIKRGAKNEHVRGLVSRPHERLYQRLHENVQPLVQFRSLPFSPDPARLDPAETPPTIFRTK